MTLAYEVTHTCKRQDIYVTGGGLSIVLVGDIIPPGTAVHITGFSPH